MYGEPWLHRNRPAASPPRQSAFGSAAADPKFGRAPCPRRESLKLTEELPHRPKLPVSRVQQLLRALPGKFVQQSH